MKFKSLIVSLFISLTLISSAFASGFMQVANVTKIQGSAFIDKEKIKVGAEIMEGMELNIPKSTDFVEVKFQNGHVVRFSGAKVKVETLNPKNTLFHLVKGKIFSLIKPLTTDETFHVKTKRASFAVRGTQFMVEESPKKTYLCVCEGVVAAKTTTGEAEVKKDEDLSLANAKAKLKVTTASKNMVDMTKKVFSDMGAI